MGVPGRRFWRRGGLVLAVGTGGVRRWVEVAWGPARWRRTAGGRRGAEGVEDGAEELGGKGGVNVPGASKIRCSAPEVPESRLTAGGCRPLPRYLASCLLLSLSLFFFFGGGSADRAMHAMATRASSAVRVVWDADERQCVRHQARATPLHGVSPLPRSPSPSLAVRVVRPLSGGPGGRGGGRHLARPKGDTATADPLRPCTIAVSQVPGGGGATQGRRDSRRSFSPGGA